MWFIIRVCVFSDFFVTFSNMDLRHIMNSTSNVLIWCIYEKKSILIYITFMFFTFSCKILLSIPSIHFKPFKATGKTWKYLGISWIGLKWSTLHCKEGCSRREGILWVHFCMFLSYERFCRCGANAFYNIKKYQTVMVI